LEGKGNLVSMTIEHATDKANTSEVSYLHMDKALHNNRFTESPGNPAPGEL
jgi:hypothetical protein